MSKAPEGGTTKERAAALLAQLKALPAEERRAVLEAVVKDEALRGAIQWNCGSKVHSRPPDN